MADEKNHDAQIAALVATQGAVAVTLSRFEKQFERLDDVLRESIRDLADDMRGRLSEAREDREKFQHDIREAVQGLAAVVPTAEASAAWIKEKGHPMHEEHESWKAKFRAVVWVGGIISFGLGGSAVEIARAILKSKGLLS